MIDRAPRVAGVVVSIGLLLVGSATALEKTSLTRAQARLSKGEKALAKEDFAAAEKLFREALAIEPALPGSHLGLGAALVGQRRFDEALAALAEAETRYVRFEQELQQAELRAKQIADQEQDAYDDMQRARHAPPPAPGAASSGDGTRSVGDLTGDRLGTTQHLVSDRWNMEEFRAIPAQVFYLEGVSHLRSGSRGEGVAALELALQLDPTHGLAHYNLAVALLGAGDPQRAQQHLDAALAAGVETHPQFVADLERALAR